MKVEKIVTEDWIYTDSKGNQQKVTQINSAHLLNAFKKSMNELPSNHPVVKVLGDEIMRRMTGVCEDNF